MKAMIFAAGLGTRLRPITDTIPKALVPVGGIPMLERVILKIKDAGIEDFVVNTHYLASQIADFLAARDFGVRIAISEEKDCALETGGGIRHAAPLLAGCGRFLVHNADILSNIDLRALIALDQPEDLATLVLREGESDRYLLFDDRMRLVGWTNVRTGEVKSPYPDFDPANYRRYAFCGVHILSEQVLAMMESWPEKFSIIDFYLAVAQTQSIRGVVAENLQLIDIGSPETLAEANADYEARLSLKSFFGRPVTTTMASTMATAADSETKP